MITAKQTEHLNFKNEIYIYVYTYTYTHTHTHTHIYIYMYTHIHIKIGFQFLLRQVRKDNGQLQKDRSLQEHTACEHLLS